MASKQKVYVDSLPEDCIQIKNYNGSEYANLFFSPSTKKFYQAPAMRYRELQYNERGAVRPIRIDGKPSSIALAALERRFKEELGINQVNDDGQ